MNELNQLASTELTSTWFGPVVEQMAAVENQLTTLLSVEGTADPSYQADLAAQVSNEGILTNLLVQVAAGDQTNM